MSLHQGASLPEFEFQLCLITEPALRRNVGKIHWVNIRFASRAGIYNELQIVLVIITSGPGLVSGLSGLQSDDVRSKDCAWRSRQDTGNTLPSTLRQTESNGTTSSESTGLCASHTKPITNCLTAELLSMCLIYFWIRHNA